MPLASRREEIDRFLSGAADVCVATDVLGHGVNLPCETLLFAETTKFDGEERRDLLPWELAQIAGRAGRFGLVERGHVGVLAGLGWGVAEPRARRVGARAARPAARRASGVPRRRRGAHPAAALRPRRRRSRCTSTPRSSPGTASRCASGRSRAGSPSSRCSRSGSGSQAVQRRLAERGRRLSLEDTWKLVNAPVDEDGLELLATLALAITGDRVARPQLTFLLDTARLRGASLEDAEQAGREASILRWFALQYAGRRRRDDRARRRARGGCRRSGSSRGSASRSSRRRSAAAARAGARARRGSRSATAARGSRRGRDMNSP